MFHALDDAGIACNNDFHVLGTQFVVDMFIPQLPRASVEVTDAISISNGKYLGEKINIHASLKDELGSSFHTLILLLMSDGEESLEFEHLPDGMQILVIKRTESCQETATAAVLKLKKILDLYRQVTLDLPVAAVISVAALLPLISAIPCMGIGAAILGSGLLTSFMKFSNESSNNVDQAKQGVNFPGHHRAVDNHKILTKPPSSAVIQTVLTQVETILETFRELANESHVVMTHEMDFLVEEFRQGHFTACALRAGRSLEFMVYELSRRWGIELQDAAFGMHQELRRHLDRLADLVGDYHSISNSLV